MSKNRTEMHKFIERLLDGKDPEEALAMLKEIIVDYFGFGSSIELEELALILGKIADDYNEEKAEIEEEEETLTEKQQNEIEEIKKAIEELKKKQVIPPQPTPYIPLPSVPSPPEPYKKRTPGPYEVDPYIRPWVGDPPHEWAKPDWTYRSDMRTAVDNLKSSGIQVTPELFQNYVSSLSRNE